MYGIPCPPTKLVIFGLKESRRPMDSRLSVRRSVRPSVRTYVRTNFLRNSRIRFFWFFSWTCDSVTVKKWQFRFLAENSKLALFWPNFSKIGHFWPKSEFFTHIFKVTHQIFSCGQQLYNSLRPSVGRSVRQKMSKKLIASPKMVQWWWLMAH